MNVRKCYTGVWYRCGGMWEGPWVRTIRRGEWRERVWAVFAALALLLAACTDTLPQPPVADGAPAPASSSTTPLVTGSPDSSTTAKVDGVYLQLFAIYQTAGLDAARLFARTQGLLTPQDEVRVTLVLDTTDPATVQGTAIAVGRLGGRVIATFDDQIELVVPLQTLAEYSKQSRTGNFFGDLAGFRHVRDVHRTPMAQTTAAVVDGSTTLDAVHGVGDASHNAPAPEYAGVSGMGRSEGVELTAAARWQAAGFTGRGVKVGVIDVGFTSYAAVLGASHIATRSFREDGKLDAPPGVGTMHGTACAEIVREMAPDADLYLAAAGETPGGFITALRWLTRTVGVSVITTSLGFYGEYPTNGTSDLAKAVDEAKAAGVVFVKSAGNQALQHYRAPFTDADHDGEHDFPGAAQRNALKLTTTGGTLQVWLNWDDWARPHVNYDLYVYDATGHEVARSTEDQSRSGKRPVEELFAAVPAGTYFVHVRKMNPGDPNLPLTIFTNPGTAMELMMADDSVTVPGDAHGALTVGAADWRTDRVERFSSHGPTLDGRTKPDLVGPDGVTSVAFGLAGPSTFSGTSASAPHVAGAVALYRGAFPAATPDVVLMYLAAHAVTPPATVPFDNTAGAGRLDLGEVPVPGATLPTTLPTRTSTDLTTTRILATGSDAFTDDFNAPTSGLPMAGYAGGTYHVTAAAGSLDARFYPMSVTAAATTFSVRAQRTGGAKDAPMGLLVRAQDRDDYLLFVATNDGTFNVYAQLNGSLRGLLNSWKTSAAIVRDGTNTLSVETTGTHFVFSANGQPLSVVEIADVWTAGAFGFAAGGGRDAGSEITFSAYRVTVTE